MYKHLAICVLGTLATLAYAPSATAQTPADSTSTKVETKAKADKKTDKKASDASTSKEDKTKEAKKKSETKYEKFFKDKKVETARGKFISLHKIDGKVYFEIPTKYFGRNMLLGATISGSTDPTVLPPGLRNEKPFIFSLSMQDSTLVMRVPNPTIFGEQKNSEELDRALKLSYRDPLFKGFKVEAYNNDSTAVVFDATDLVGGDDKYVDVIPKSSQGFAMTSRPNRDLTFVRALKAFDTNVSIRTEQKYNVDLTAGGGLITLAKDAPVSIEVLYTVALLPEERMSPRLIDTRVGVGRTTRLSFVSGEDFSQTLHLATRWRLEPKDPEAYARGKQVEVRKPIVFYIDPGFPSSWKASVREGVLAWNKAFERIGYKNAIQAVEFPSDKSFDPDNIEFTTIRFVPSTQEDIFSPKWIDLRSGEILGATIIVNSGNQNQENRLRFAQTASVDASLRGERVPSSKYLSALKARIMHHVGLSLGFTVNAAGSAAYDVESLRSAAFTQKNGISASVLDRNHYNYVAQPGDKGVSLVQQDLGPYDFYAVEWNYRAFPKLGGDMRREARELEAFVDKHTGDPRYRYGALQTQIFDPSAVSEDLGNDPIKAANYALKNFQTAQKNLSSWVTKDPDSRKKQEMTLALAQQHYFVIKNVMHQIGGIYYNDSKESLGVPRYQVLDKSKQRASMKWVLDQAVKFDSYANRALERKGFVSTSYYDQLMAFFVQDLLSVSVRLMYAEKLAGSQAYTQKEYYDDLFEASFRSLTSGKAPNKMEMMMQKALVELAIGTLEGKRPMLRLPAGMSFFFKGEDLQSIGQGEEMAQNDTAFGNPGQTSMPVINLASVNVSNRISFQMLSKLQPMLERAVASTKDATLKGHYQLMLIQVKKALDEKN